MLRTPFARLLDVAPPPATSSTPSDADTASTWRITRGLDADGRAHLLQAGHFSSHRAGRVLYTPATHATDMHVVDRGLVRIVRQTGGGKRLTTALIGHGALFGEDALTSARLRSNTAVIVEDDTRVFRIPAEDLLVLAGQMPTLARNLVAAICDRLVHVHEFAERLAYWSVRQRFAGLLLELDEQFGRPTLDGHRTLTVPLTQSELAAMLGSTRKSLAMLLAELKRDGIIEIRRRRLVIVDRERVCALACDAATTIAA